jgi:DNA polymerase III epsilon subunit-like protein
MKFSDDIVVFDLEASCKTFGHNEVEESNIIEIGAVRLDRKTLEVKSEFSALVKPRDYPILPEIAEITGITPEMVEHEKTFDQAILPFLEWFGDRNKATLAGWGLYYDLPLLRKEFRVFGFDYNQYFVGGGLDIRSLAILWMAQNNISTSGITIERTLLKMNLSNDYKYHRALDDARATGKVLKYLINLFLTIK